METQQEMRKHTEGELPEFKIFDLLSSVGNGEHHALDLTVMRKGVIYPEYDHYKEMIDHQENNRKWNMNHRLPFQHCQRSLVPIGLVALEALSTDGSTWGHRITEYGLTNGVPFAGGLLEWSHEHPNFSLYKMFGSIHSSSINDEQAFDKKRAPETRYKILWEIVTNPSNRMRLSDVSDAINGNIGLIHDHLRSLSRNGIISYEAIERGKPTSYFKLKDIVPNEEPEPYRKDKTLSARAYRFLAQYDRETPVKYFGTEEIANNFIQEFPEYQNVNIEFLRRRLSGILTNLFKQGYAQRQQFSYGFQSEIMLSNEQREAIVSLVTLIDKFKNGDTQAIRDGREFAQKVASDRNLFSDLMLKAKEASPFANKTNREDMDGWIISILHESPNSSVKQIQQNLSRVHGKNLAEKTIQAHLLRLAKKQKIISEETKAGNIYRVVDTDNQAIPSN